MRVPKITCLVPASRGYVPLDEQTSRTPMRLTRIGKAPPDEPPLSYGQYFQAVVDVLSQDTYGLLCEAASKSLARQISVSDVKAVLIYAEKHGSDYHPARIEVMTGKDRAVFVMNVAVTHRGKARLSREFEILQRLDRKYHYPFLPRAYCQGEVFLEPTGNHRPENAIVMFLADWFQGYHEFHLSMDKGNGGQRLLLWDTDQGPRYLSPQQAKQIYHQAAMILTVYYDPETYEQIFPWHHAAGDFVVKAPGEALDVKLVTARQYASMIESNPAVSPPEALLFFLLNLSLRMRLDRLDGVGPVAWADGASVDAAFAGFFEALRMKEKSGDVAAGLLNAFVQYCASLSKQDLSDRLGALVRACDPSAPDLPVIESHLERHVLKSYTALQRLMTLGPFQPGYASQTTL